MLNQKVFPDKLPTNECQENHSKFDEAERDAPHYWFKKWLKFQRILGLTYSGTAGYKREICYRKRGLLITYDFLTGVLLSAYYLYFYIFNDHNFFETKTDKILMRAIIKIGSIAFAVQFVLMKMILLLYGNQIMMIICPFKCSPRDGLKVSKWQCFKSEIYVIIEFILVVRQNCALHHCVYTLACLWLCGHIRLQ